MTARVTWPPPNPQTSGITVAAPVDSRELLSVSRMLNYLIGKGGVAVCSANPYRSYTTTPLSKTYNFRYKQTNQALYRLWVLNIVPTSSLSVDGTYYFDVTVGGVTYEARVDLDAAGFPKPVFILEPISSPASSLISIAITVELKTAYAGSSPMLRTIQCFELPRMFLDPTASEGGVLLDDITPNSPIYAATGRSMQAIESSVAELDNCNRRQCLYAFAVHTTDASTTTSASLVDIFAISKIPCLPAKLHSSDTTRSLTCSAYARVSSGGTTGSIRFDSTVAAANASISVSSTSWSWQDVSLTVQSEDLTTAKGWPGGGTEYVQFRWQRTGGAGNVELAGLRIGTD